MTIKFPIKYNPAGLILLVVLLVVQLVWQASAQAVTVQVSAEFTPSRNNPNNRTFTNTSNVSGVCSGAHKDLCRSLGVFSINMRSSVTDSGTKMGDGVRGYGRGSLYFGLPGPRTITVTSDTGETATVIFRIVGAAFRIHAEDTPMPVSDVRSYRGCREAFGNAEYQTNIMRIMLADNGGSSQSACAFEMLGDGLYSFSARDLVYEIETPEPLNMKNGIYRGVSSYSVGGMGHDFDYGDGVNIVDPSLNIEFALTVNHMFALEFPPGSDTAVLQPLGGWSQWTDYKKVPATLRKDQHFTVSGSTNFSVNLSCEFPMPDGRCGISNGVSTVPLDVAITMPGFLGRIGMGFMEAVDYPLTASPIDVPRFSPKEGAVFQRRSYLRFEVNGEPIKEMVTHPGTQYKGRVTVIFDADM